MEENRDTSSSLPSGGGPPKPDTEVRLSRRGGEYWTMKPGDTLAHFRVVREINRGHSGTVYQGFEDAMNRAVAIKVLSRDYAEDKHYVELFYQEARAVARLHHPNIVQIHYVGEQGGKIFYVMEFFEGAEVADLIKERGRVALADAVQIIRHTAQGLEYAHKHGIIHRDIKPTNIMLTADGVAKVSDFALAKDLRSGQALTETGRLMGTPLYVAPEHARGGKIDHRADIYSLGCTMFHLVTGRAPFEGPSTAAILIKHLKDPVPDARGINPQISAALAGIIGRMMAKNPDDRYLTYHDLVVDLDQVVTRGLTSSEGLAEGVKKVGVHRARTGGTTVSGMPAKAPEVKKKVGLSKQMIGITAGTIIFLLVVALLFFSKNGKEQNIARPPEIPDAPPPPPPGDPTGVPSVAPVMEVKGESLDLQSAMNADLIWAPNHKPPQAFDAHRQQPTTWITAGFATKNNLAASLGLPDDGKIAIPEKLNTPGTFQLASYGRDSLIALTTAVEGGYSQVEIALSPTQQQKYRSLVFLHASSGGNGKLRLTIQYEDGSTSTHTLDLTDWRNLGGNITTLSPRNSFVVQNREGETVSPFGVFSFDKATRVASAGLAAQAITNLKPDLAVHKIILARPVATTPPPQISASAPENDRFLAVIFAINAVPADSKLWEVAKALEEKFRAATATAAQLSAEGKFSEAIAQYEKVADSADAGFGKLAAHEIARLTREQTRADRNRIFQRQLELNKQIQTAIAESLDAVGAFQFLTAVKTLEPRLAQVTDPEAKIFLTQRLDDFKRIAPLHQQLITRLSAPGISANYALRNGDVVRGVIEHVDEAGIRVRGDHTSWAYIAPEVMQQLYRSVMDPKNPDHLIAFAVLCLEQEPRWPGAAENLDKAEKLKPDVASVTVRYRAALAGSQIGEDPKVTAVDALLRSLSDAVNARQWDRSVKLLADIQKRDSADFNADQKKVIAQLTPFITAQHKEMIAARAEGAVIAQEYKYIAARRAEMKRSFGNVVTVRADGGSQYKTISDAIHAASGAMAIELAPGRYNERITINKPARIAIYALPGDNAVLDKVVIEDNFYNVLLDNLIFAPSAGEVIQASAPKGESSQIQIRQCAFLGRGIKLNNCGPVVVTDCLFFKRGLNVDKEVSLFASHNLFLGEPILLNSTNTRLVDNLFVSTNEAFIITGELTPSFLSDNNAFQPINPTKFVRITSASSTLAAFPTPAEWQAKAQRDQRSQINSEAGFTDPENGNYLLKPDSPFYGKASDRTNHGPRWSAAQWQAFQQSFRDIGTTPSKSASMQ